MKVYIKKQDGYVVDMVTYDPKLEGYNPYDVESFPIDVMNGYYTFENGVFTLDGERKVYMEELGLDDLTKQLLSFSRMTINERVMTDEQALELKKLYPLWSSRIGGKWSAGERCTYGEKLFNVLQDVEPVLEIYPPSIHTAANYAEINEMNKGTFDDPIPYSGNMELKEGIYYSQLEVKYRCTRDTGQPVYNPLSELVGIYVEVVQ